MTVSRQGHTRVTKGGTVTHVRAHRMKGSPAEAPQRVPRSPHREKLSLVRDASISGTAGLLAGSLARLVLILPLAIVVTLVTILATLITLQVRALGGGKKRRRVKYRTKAKRWAKRKGKLAVIGIAKMTRGRETARASTGGRVTVDGMRPEAYPAGGRPRRSSSQRRGRYLEAPPDPQVKALQDEADARTIAAHRRSAGLP